MTSFADQVVRAYEVCTGKTFEADAGAVKEHATPLYGQLAAKTAHAEPTKAPENHIK